MFRLFFKQELERGFRIKSLWRFEPGTQGGFQKRVVGDPGSELGWLLRFGLLRLPLQHFVCDLQIGHDGVDVRPHFVRRFLHFLPHKRVKRLELGMVGRIVQSGIPQVQQGSESGCYVAVSGQRLVAELVAGEEKKKGKDEHTPGYPVQTDRRSVEGYHRSRMTG